MSLVATSAVVRRRPLATKPLNDTDRRLEATSRLGVASVTRVPTILCPTDFSEDARHAFDLACRLAGARGAQVTVLHVAPPASRSFMGMAPLVPLPKGYRVAWESRLRMLQAADPSMLVEYRVEEGNASREIVRVAHETSCDLIVMGPDRRTGLAGLFKSSVTDEVRRNVACPVVAVTGSKMRSKGGMILHATDFSRPAAYAFELARSLARDSGDELVVVHVASIPLLYAKRGYQEEVEEALRRMTKTDSTVGMRWVLAVGDPLSEMLRIAQELPCDLLVLGTNGHAGLKRLLRRSVARQVQRHAACPVITVKPPPHGAGLTWLARFRLTSSCWERGGREGKICRPWAVWQPKSPASLPARC